MSIDSLIIWYLIVVDGLILLVITTSLFVYLTTVEK